MTKTLCCLLVDDDTDDKEIFNYGLRAIDPEIILHYSPTGIDAVKNLSSGNYKPDYIFLDLNMAPMSGLETLEAIKEIPACATIPVIIYSTTISEEMFEETKSLGAFDHLPKPSKQVELENYLKKIFHAT